MTEEENRNELDNTEVTEEEAVETANEQVQVDTPDNTSPEDVMAENEEQEVRPAVESANASTSESMSDVMRDVVDIAPGDLVQGTVLTIDNEKQVIVGLSGGQEGVIPPRELASERFDHPSDIVSIGDTIDVVVLRDIKDKEQGSFVLSKKRVDQRKVWEE